MGLGITVQKPIDMADCGCEITGGGQGRASDSDAAADYWLKLSSPPDIFAVSKFLKQPSRRDKMSPVNIHANN